MLPAASGPGAANVLPRRHWLRAAAVSLAAPVLGAGCGTVATAPAGRAAAGLRPQALAPGVHLVRGHPGEVEPANRGWLANVGFIVGPEGVLVVNAGVSHAQGRALLDVAAALSDRPVRAVVITSVRQEFLFGAAAFRERGIPVHMQRRAAHLMAARCDTCLKTLNTVLGADEMRGTAMFKPDVVFDDSHRLDLIGRPVSVLHFGHSSGPGDVAVRDDTTGVLFAGGLADAERIPDVQDSNLPGWHRALARLRALEPRWVVPGHGPAGTAAVLDATERYLSQLEARADAFVRRGMALSEVADALTLPEYERWDQYDNIHRRNASIVFLRLERDHILNPDEGAPR